MKSPVADNIFPDPKHDHDKCLKQAVQKARGIFATRNLKLTPLREQIYRQILTAHTALGAYEIRDHLNKTDRNIAPITIYRILDLLRQNGLIHRLESQNTYYACHHNHQNETSFVTLICRGCGVIVELMDDNINKAFDALEQNADFLKEHRVLEIEGLCPQCHEPSR